MEQCKPAVSTYFIGSYTYSNRIALTINITKSNELDPIMSGLYLSSSPSARISISIRVNITTTDIHIKKCMYTAYKTLEVTYYAACSVRIFIINLRIIRTSIKTVLKHFIRGDEVLIKKERLYRRVFFFGQKKFPIGIKIICLMAEGIDYV